MKRNTNGEDGQAVVHKSTAEVQIRKELINMKLFNLFNKETAEEELRRKTDDAAFEKDCIEVLNMYDAYKIKDKKIVEIDKKRHIVINCASSIKYEQCINTALILLLKEYGRISKEEVRGIIENNPEKILINVLEERLSL